MNEAYCSFEIAKLLKEKGFDECIFEFYVGDRNRIKYARNGVGFRPSELLDICYPHITHQSACAWLREVHGIHVSAIPCAKPQRIIVWQQNIINLNPIKEGGMFLQLEPHRKDYNSYEEACEAALKYVLENLIRL